MKGFNTTGICFPEKHYMVDISERIAKIREMIERGDWFCINRGRQYGIELKIWRGNAYNERGEEQLSEYLDYFHLDTGYLVSFCFNKGKVPGVKEICVGGKIIVEGVV